jgi:spermidine synthase
VTLSAPWGTRLFLPGVFIAFTASGFAGLIYESIWSHYLKLFLGHAAYAQTLVLAIFMGGMALGAWLASRRAWRDPLLVYAVIEAVIGGVSLVFHDVFVTTVAFAFDQVIPSLGSPATVHAFKWALAALLILPQCVLLGMTFPLLTAGVLRSQPRRAGYVVAMLYFTNSLGGAAGVLASGFFFIKAAGLPGTLVAAAIGNLAVSAAIVLLRNAQGATAAPVKAVQAAAPARDLRILLVVAALTGLSSFMYEVGWIRMLSLVLGSSTHAFELMLSAFILGLAFGGLWVRRRIDATPDAVRLLAYVQIVMGVAAIATLPIYASSFDVMQVAMRSLTATEGGYIAFNFISHAICIAVMFPAAFCAGMTLPLITAALLRAGAGERAIGQVYAANTAGAIAGVMLAVHVGFPLLGIKGLIIAGAAVDLALGVFLLARARSAWLRPAGAALLAGGVVFVAIFGVRLDAHEMASGVFRFGQLLQKDGREWAVSHDDGKTATISVTRTREGLTALRTNGKSEGAISSVDAPPNTDEINMALMGALPLFLAPQATRFANIGFGTGMTTHAMLGSSRVESVDTIEIEPAVVRAGQYFRPLNDRALDDPRSRIHYDDAKTYFSSRQATYDVIISEPSNPWVSGVATLFSTEFYRDVRRYLRPGGLLIQWLQVYEMSPQLVATVIAALEANFTDYEIWYANHGDLLVVAAHQGRVGRPDGRAFDEPGVRADLERIGIRNMNDLLMHRVGGRAALGPYFAAFGAEANSDFYPVLDLNAAYARFLRQSMEDVPQLLEAPLPLFEFFDRADAPHVDAGGTTAGSRPWLRRAAHGARAVAAARYLREGTSEALAAMAPGFRDDLYLLREALVGCRLNLPAGTVMRITTELAATVNPHVPRAEREAMWRTLTDARCIGRVPQKDRDWLHLHAAVGAAQAVEMGAAAERLLASEKDISRDLIPYVLAVHMTGLILQNHGMAAHRSFGTHRGKLSGAVSGWQPIFRFLVAQADVPRAPQ